MGRWEAGGRSRLERAAMDLFRERGYEQTTVTEIAERAGLTQRTFFRHFADKREVLFAGGATLQEVIVTAAVNAPASLSPIEAIAAGLQAGSALLQDGREYAGQRQAVIAANADLRERELIKLASIASALAEALRQRGVADPEASLSAEIGIAVFRVAFEAWVDPTNKRSLAHVIRETLQQLPALTTGTS